MLVTVLIMGSMEIMVTKYLVLIIKVLSYKLEVGLIMKTKPLSVSMSNIKPV